MKIILYLFLFSCVLYAGFVVSKEQTKIQMELYNDFSKINKEKE